MKEFSESDFTKEVYKPVKLYRYELADGDFEKRSTSVSHPDLVGRWFVDNIKDLSEYILMRKPGGTIITVEVPEDKLEELNARNNSIAKDMDIEGDNWIIPDEYLARGKKYLLPVAQEKKKFTLSDMEAIRNYLETLE